MITAEGARTRSGGTLRGWGRDAVIAVVSAALLAAVSAHVKPGSGDRAVDVAGYLLLVLAGLAMGVCRRWPRLATVAVTAVLCVFIARHYPNGPVWLTGWVVLAVLSWQTDRRTAVAGALGMLAALSVTAAAAGGFGPVIAVVYLGWSAAAVFGGDAARSRRSHLAGLVERARITERGREDEAARRVAEERLRIARDLHDSVAHAMATINVQAAAAAHVVARQPAAAGTALTAIQQASAEVLDELGSMLAVLRDDTEQAERAPAPGLGDIRRLADSAGPSGLAVELCLDEPPPAVAPALGTAAYRVVQESLTNVLRHSLARSVRVRVGTVPAGTGPAGTGPAGTGPAGTGPDGTGPAGGLLVEVHDPGPARPDGTGGTGVGIRGMRERVTATGGQFAAGSTAGGGFAVRAQWRGSR